MGIGRGKNRRRTDAAGRAEALRTTASRLGTLALRVGAAALVIAVLFFGGRHLHRWATTSETFALEAISVSGTLRADQVELCRMAGLSPGQNLFRMDVRALTRAMERHPWVRAVRVTRHFPSSLSIEVEEHEPAALVSLGELYLLDGTGEPFKKLEANDAVDLPLVTGISREQYVEKPEEAAGRFRDALTLLATYQAESAAAEDRVSELHLRGPELILVTRGGTELRLGADDFEAKLARLQRVRAELRRRGVSAEVIHLDNRVRPGWVAVKLSTHSSERGSGSLQ